MGRGLMLRCIRSGGSIDGAGRPPREGASACRQYVCFWVGPGERPPQGPAAGTMAEVMRDSGYEGRALRGPGALSGRPSEALPQCLVI